MRRNSGQKRTQGARRTKGQKANKKQMSYVGAVYTIDRFVRTADDVLDGMASSVAKRNFRHPMFTGLAATSKTIKENPQMVKRMVRAIVRSVIYTRDNPEDALQIMSKRLGLSRDAALDAYQMIREALVPVPTERGVELMAQWQAIALNTKPKRKPAEYMDLRFVNEVMAELGQK